MSAAWLWIIFPAVTALGLFLFRRSTLIVSVVGSGVALLAAWAAWQIPISDPLSIGPLSIKITETLSIFGREFTLANADRPFLAFIFFATALWLAGAYFIQPGELFVPLGMAMVALMVAALAVEPFLYAALIIEIAALISIPLLAPPRKPAGRGIFRFLTFQTLGMPFILFTGWMLTGVGSSPADLELVVRASALLGLGFAFLLAIFPFHTWLPMMAEEVHPYVTGFVFFLLPLVISLFGLSFLDRYVWLRETQSVYLLLRSVGVVMVIAGGLWAAFQSHMGRMFAFAAVMETGLSLVAVGLESAVGISMFFALFVPRLLSYLVWAAALAMLYRVAGEQLSFSAVQGMGVKYPIILPGLLSAQFSLIGIPLFAGFPIRLALWSDLARVSPMLSLGALFGSIGLLIGSLRMVNVLLSPLDNSGALEAKLPSEETSQFPESFGSHSLIIFSAMSGILFLAGLFPQWAINVVRDISQMFEHLGS